MPTSSYLRTFLLSTLCASLSLVLVSCGNAPAKSSADTTASVSAKNSAKALLDRAKLAESPERENLFLAAGSAYIDEKKFERALGAVSLLDEDALNNTQIAQLAYIKAAVALNDGATLDAFNILTSPRLEQQWSGLDSTYANPLREQRARTFSLLGEFEAAVDERFLLAETLTKSADKKANTNALWSGLLSMPIARLEYLSQNSPKETARGWYNLATIGKNTQYDLVQQQTMINQWRRQWPSHPAASALPDDLNLIKDLIASQPKHIALLLPEQGKLKEAGDAVRDGFFAAYYQAVDGGRALPQISLIDSSKNVSAAYDEAISRGADLVIGPLDKESVTELAQKVDLPKPILTLNYADASVSATQKNFYQFGLAIEDEARQVARQAFTDGHRQAMMIIPDQEWSERSSRAFAEEWQKLGGKIVNTSRFQVDENFSRMIKDAMLIEESVERARKLENLIGIKLETSPRARADVDMIFLIANPVQARQIKPTFSFHYASNIPVYATSQVYSGESNPKLDRDLNGIRFNTMPWLFDTNSEEKRSVKQNSSQAAVYDRLQALGVDAFKVYARLPQLVQVEQMRVFGATGTLRMLPNGRIEREQVWARFKNGNAEPQASTLDIENELR